MKVGTLGNIVAKVSENPTLESNSEEEKATGGHETPSSKRPEQEEKVTQGKIIASAQSAYGKRFRHLHDKLNACGISNYIDTPTIAIIGSQSAGKSSVLEALSEIAFPRASGTCTRCSTEVRMFNAAQPWTCKISLRIETSAQGQSLNKIRHIPFGPPLTDKALVQQRIRAAQRAILNRSKDPTTFLSDDLDSNDGDESGFSENTICLEVRGESLVRDLILDALKKLIEKHAGECRKLIEQAIVTESSFLCTLNQHYFVDKRDTYIDRLPASMPACMATRRRDRD